MKKVLHFKKELIFAISLLLFSSVYSKTFTSVKNGNWNNASTWSLSAGSGGTAGVDYPSIDDSVFVNHNVNIVATNVGANFIFEGYLNIGTNGFLRSTIGNNVDGFILSDHAQMHIYGTFYTAVIGEGPTTQTVSPREFVQRGYSQLVAYSGAQMYIADDWELSNHAQAFLKTGVCARVDDDLNLVGTNWFICGPGDVSIGGDGSNSIVEFFSGATVNQMCSNFKVSHKATSSNTSGYCNGTTVKTGCGPTGVNPVALNDTAYTTKNQAISIDVLHLGIDDYDPNFDDFWIVGAGTETWPYNQQTFKGGSAIVNNNGTPNNYLDDYIVYTPPTNFTGVDQFKYKLYDSEGRYDTARVTVYVGSPSSICGSQYIEVIGKGIQGAASGTQSLSFSNVSSIDSIVCEVAFKGGRPSWLKFNGVNAVGITANNSSWNEGVYRLKIAATANVNVTYSSVSGIQSFVARVYRSNSPSAVTSIFNREVTYLYHNSKTITQVIPTGTAKRDIKIQVPISEMNNDGRSVLLEAWAGSVSASLLTYTYDLGPSLKIMTVILMDVPANVSNVTVKVTSPNSGGNNGDSFVVSGYNFTIQCNDNPPVAVDDNATTSKNTPVNINVLTNDAAGSNPLVPSTATNAGLLAPLHGSVTFNNGVATYTPNNNYVGMDVFQYQVCDTKGLCAIATVTVTISNCVNGLFTEVGSSLGLDLTGAKDGGLAWGDFNNDGLYDVIVNTNDWSKYSRLYFASNSGGSIVFNDVTATHAAGLLNNVTERQALAADFNNDGYVDIVRNYNTRIEIYFNKGASASPAYSFGTSSQGPNQSFTSLSGGMNTEGISIVDFNQDGWLDLVLDNHDNGNEVLINNKNNTFTQMSPGNGAGQTGFPASSAYDGDYTTSVDYDNDGFIDFMVRKGGNGDDLYHFNPTTGRFEAKNPNLPSDNNEKGAITFSDLDQDGDLDFIWAHRADNDNTDIYVNNNGVFTFSKTLLICEAGIEEVDIADIDNDGDNDVFLGDDAGQSYIFLNNTTRGAATLSFTRNNKCLDPNADVEGSEFVDYDNDGDMDLYMNINNGPNQFWINSTNNNNFLKVEPRYRLAGGKWRSAIGANVVLGTCNTTLMMMDVSGGRGHGSQKPGILNFGLENGPNVLYKVTVYFTTVNGQRDTVIKTVTPAQLTGQKIIIYNDDVDDNQCNVGPIDIDQDDDGILDIDENAACLGSIHYEFYDGTPVSNGNFSVDGIPTTGALASGDISDFDVNALQNAVDPGDADSYAIRYSGTINIATAGTYTFFTTSDDGSKLYIDNNLVVNNDGDHSSKEEDGNITLTAGNHTITILFFENGGTSNLSVAYRLGTTIPKQALPFSSLSSGFFCDSDGDGIPNYLDLDSDNDGIPDIIEAGGVDANNDGRVDDPTDTDGDGWADTFDPDNGGTPLVNPDSDGDGIPDYLDLDSDNDGIPDIIEAGGVDANNDGKVDNPIDTDGDGWADTFDSDNGGTALPVPDSDGDGKKDYLDLDSDNDGIPDIIEAGGVDANNDGRVDNPTDTDGDGWADTFDSDNGGTNLPLPDTDGDGVKDYLDLDSDNDGIPDIIEAGGVDANNDGRVDDPTDTDGDGWADTFDPDNGGTPLVNPDSDGDGIPDYLDLDSDNDGIPDIIEAGGVDANNDGKVDNPIDTDGDGWADTFDSDNGGTALPVPDSDGDGKKDYLDLDSDNDGIPDIIEAGGVDANNDGRVDNPTDTDGDGWADTFDSDNGGTNLPLPDTDGDGVKDYLDLDSDNDGIPDIIEAGGVDANNDGRVDNPTDTDGDGWANTFDSDNGGTALTYPDSDGDGKRDYLDLDSDNDGIPDIIEAGGVDANNDGKVDNPTDTDGDGWADTFDSNNGGTALPVPDTDGDGKANYIDLDSDNDGIPDIIEAGGVDTNNDGRVDNPADTDGDGWANTFDSDNGGIALPTPDTDGDGKANYIDLDSDNDGIPDIIEAGGVDTNNDGKVDNPADTDGDGWANTFDSNNGGSALPYPDTDGDGKKDYLDLDSDNDGIPDIIEAGGVDANNDGRVDNPADTNGNGWADIVDPTNGGTALPIWNTDSDGKRDYVDLDSDNDGLTDTYEAGGADANNDGIIDGFVDTDANGLHDGVQGSGNALPLTDTDGDSRPNYRDKDSDGDGLTDAYEAGGLDANGDGEVDGFTDSNNNGLNDANDGNLSGTAPTKPNSDSDPYPNYLDLDSDNDGIADVIEAGGVDANKDGKQDGADTDFNGLSDLVDPNNGGTKLPISNNDGDAFPNHLDIDADNDGIVDNVEGQTTIAFLAPTGFDTDGDGWDDRYDSDNGGTAITISNKDGIDNPDWLDFDTDNDGQPDWVEGFDDDIDGDALNDLKARAAAFEAAAGSPNYYNNANDSDSDQIPNWLEDDNSNGQPNFLDPTSSFYHDTDNDGLVDLYDTDTYGVMSILPNADADLEPDWRDVDNIITLPITLLSFDAEKQVNSVLLNWVTVSEINNDYFTIEKSTNGIDFISVGTVKGSGNSTEKNEYSLVDAKPYNGVSYYRLKQTDYNGSFTYSDIRVVEFKGKSSSDSKIYPNPSKGGGLFLDIVNPPVGEITIHLKALDGSLLKEMKMPIEADIVNFEVEILRGMTLSAGTYLVSYQVEGGEVVTFKYIVKN